MWWLGFGILMFSGWIFIFIEIINAPEEKDKNQ